MSSHRVWKYPLKIDDKQVVITPSGARFLSVQMQGKELCAWALVDPQEPMQVQRDIRIYGTGHELNIGDVSNAFQELVYIATFQAAAGRFVGHVFERIGA